MLNELKNYIFKVKLILAYICRSYVYTYVIANGKHKNYHTIQRILYVRYRRYLSSAQPLSTRNAYVHSHF